MTRHVQLGSKALNAVTSFCPALIVLALLTPTTLASLIVPDTYTVVLDHFEGSTAGSPHGTPVFQSGVPGLENSVGLDLGSFIQYGLPSALETQGTIEMWLKPSTTVASIINFNWNDTTSYPPAGHVLHLGIDGAGEISAGGWALDPANMYTLTSGALIPVGQWSHVALSWGSGARLYVNGAMSASSSQPWHPSSPSWAYLNYWGGTSLGLVDELHISRIQRTDAEIAEHARIVPEPSSWALVGVALVALFIVRRQRVATSRSGLAPTDWPLPSLIG
ncbi:MAG: PEP-CTERM sorting domain-containing protein [Bryobacterales bacterium]|nr:PEP-CTERM sorting domain-containing protein [Bryobacterales bacterium]